MPCFLESTEGELSSFDSFPLESSDHFFGQPEKPYIVATATKGFVRQSRRDRTKKFGFVVLSSFPFLFLLTLQSPLPQLLPMTRPALSISPLLRSDIPSLPDIYQLSFRPTLINRYCFPAVLPLAYVPWITARITAALDAREKGEREDVLVAKRGEEEKASVEGYAWYSFAEAKGEREKKEGRTVRWFPEGAEVDRTQRFMWRMDDHKETIEEAHYCTSLSSFFPVLLF